MPRDTVQEFISKYNSIDPPVYFSLPEGQKKMVRVLLYAMLTCLGMALLYSIMITMAVSDGGSDSLVEWLNNTQPFVDFMAKLIPIINHYPADYNNYADLYVRVHQSNYAVSWALGIMFMVFATVQLLVLQQTMWLKTTDGHRNGCKKIIQLGSIFLIVGMYLGYFGALYLAEYPWSITLFLCAFFILVYGFILGVIGLIIYYAAKNKEVKNVY